MIRSQEQSFEFLYFILLQITNLKFQPFVETIVFHSTRLNPLFFLFARKVDFGAKFRREQMQERATDVGPVKNKEKKREREREREREGRKDQKIEVSAPMSP